MGWTVEKSRRLTKRERKEWPKRAVLEEKRALVDGFIAFNSKDVGYRPMFPTTVQDDLLAVGLARYVASCKDLSGHRKASELLYVHKFVLEVERYVAAKHLSRLRIWKWQDKAHTDFWDKVTQFIDNPDACEAIRGGMELELEAERTPAPRLDRFYLPDPMPNFLIQSGASDLFASSPEMRGLYSQMKQRAQHYVTHNTMHDAFEMHPKGASCPMCDMEKKR